MELSNLRPAEGSKHKANYRKGRGHGSGNGNRFDNMQQHTGEHIFSGLICAAHGCNNVGFHLSDQTVTMDYDRAVSAEEIAEIEARANEVIWRDLPVICAFPSDEELAGLDYRSKKELSGRIRIVTIPDVDVCACCAPHVRRTGEVGLLKVLALQNYKGGIRVTIACGGRALRELSENRRILTEMAREMSTAPEEVPAHVAKLKEELSAAKGRASALAGSLLMMRLEAEDPSGSAGLLTVFDGATDPGSARHALDAWMDSHAGLCAIFTGSDADGWNYLAGAGRLGEADAREVVQTLKAAFGAKGGGSREMVQGRVQSAEAEIRRALQKEEI